MKRSERINQIQDEIYETHKKGCFQHGFEPCGVSRLSCKSIAIEMYLDEQFPNLIPHDNGVQK